METHLTDVIILQNYVNWFVWLLVFGNAFSVVVGVIMMVSPEQLQALTSITDRWISLRKLAQPLDASVNTDTLSLKYPRVAGAIIMLAAIYILIQGGLFVIGLNPEQGGQLLQHIFTGRSLPIAIWDVLWLSLVIFIFLGAVFALLVGAMALFNQVMLHKLATPANRWESSRKWLEPVEISHSSFDQTVRKNPRIWGAIITILALYVLIVLILFVGVK
ncbi:MAG: hypothetical protein L0Y67_02425 [Gammaproteobacteria bacterium]|nr:hypothetical protein [Gammaproteobacteria bacterium]MCI0590456.1 hypothetical protein [Gammaproteobacteria bacterium]